MKTAANIPSELLSKIQSDITTPNPPKSPAEPHTTPENSPPIDPTELQSLNANHRITETDEISLYLFKGEESPNMLQQIGIGRATTFAAIGAGSGLTVDLAPEDQYYHHLALWDNIKHQLIGAYRIGIIPEIIKEHGTASIYLHHIFNIDPSFYNHLGKGLELSRSFILPQYQKDPRMLDMLWKGLGHLARITNADNMFGSVTISDTFTPLSKAILVDTLTIIHSDQPETRKLISAKYPFTPTTTTHNHATQAYSKSSINKLNNLILHLENNHRPIPPLIRYYLALGAKFLSFQAEPSFNNAIYCLLKVNLSQIPPRYKKRFLG